MKAGVVGLGVGEQHIIGYRRVGVEVAAICDLDQAKAKSVAAKYDIPRIADDFDDLLDECDMVCIASYDNYHGGQVVRALNAGKHVFCEKPLCMSWAELEAIKDAIRPGLILTMNLPLRVHWARILKANYGQIVSTTGRYKWGRNRKFSGWRGKMGGYSLTLGGGIHLLDIQMSLHQGKLLGIVPTVALDGLLVGTTIVLGNSVATTISDFSYDGPHGHELTVIGNKACSIDINHDPVDKTALIPGFVGACLGDGKVEPTTEHVFSLMEVCLCVEDALACVKQQGNARSIQ